MKVKDLTTKTKFTKFQLFHTSESERKNCLILCSIWTSNPDSKIQIRKRCWLWKRRWHPTVWFLAIFSYFLLQVGPEHGCWIASLRGNWSHRGPETGSCAPGIQKKFIRPTWIQCCGSGSGRSTSFCRIRIGNGGLPIRNWIRIHFTQI